MVYLKKYHWYTKERVKFRIVIKHRIYKEIKDKITSSEVSPGTVLVERNISNKFGLSRSPIREILWYLTPNGLVNKDSSGGYVVRKISIDDIINIF